MDFSTIRPALKSWVSTQLGIDTVWRDEAQDYTVLPRAKLNMISSRGVGIDELRHNIDEGQPLGSDLVPTVSGLREFTLSIFVESDDQTAGNTAMQYLENLRTSLSKPSVIAGFKAAEVAWQRAEPVVPIEQKFDDFVESAASLDVVFNANANEADTDEGGSYVSTAEVTAHLLDPGGSDVGWVDEIMGDV